MGNKAAISFGQLPVEFLSAFGVLCSSLFKNTVEVLVLMLIILLVGVIRLQRLVCGLINLQAK